MELKSQPAKRSLPPNLVPTIKKSLSPRQSKEEGHISKRQRLEEITPSAKTPEDQNNSDAKTLRPGKPTKRVSFTSETKAEDGDSSKTLTSNWESQFALQDLLLGPDYDLSISEPHNTKKKTKTVENSAKPYSALDYLTKYHESRDSWKFNKSKEIWILKHLFSLDKIPVEYDTALTEYLQGLRSTASRTRLIHRAQEIIADPPDKSDDTEKIQPPATDMENPELRETYRQESVNSYKRKLGQHLDQAAEQELEVTEQGRLAKRRRAEITLWAFDVAPATSQNVSNGNVVTSTQVDISNNTRPSNRLGENGKGTSQVKKRKNRTSVIDMSSDSSSDESDSSDDGQAKGYAAAARNSSS